MKLAISTENNMVAQHFGRCPEYTLVELADGKAKEVQTIANPGHEPGFLPRFLAQQGVTCVISGGMGARARNLFAENNIETMVGISGPVEQVIEDYLNNQLKPGASRCEHPQGDHGCS